jgi:hypothetical protein
MPNDGSDSNGDSQNQIVMFSNARLVHRFRNSHIAADERRFAALRRASQKAAASHAAALEDAIRGIEDDIAAEETNSAAAINEVLSTGRSWKPLAIVAGALVAVIAVSALLYTYLATRGSGIVAAGLSSSSPKASRGREDVVLPDLKAGVDGGSSGEGLPFCAATASGILPHHRRSGIDRDRSGKPLPLSDRWQQFRAPVRHRDCARVPEGRQLLSGHEQA